MNKHFVTLPDGSVHTRNSKTHTYGFAIAVYGPNWNTPEPTWGVWSWSGTRANAEKAAAQARKVYATVEIIPAEIK